MHVDEKRMLQLFGAVNTAEAKRIYFAEPEPFPIKQTYIHPCARIITVLDGVKRIEFARGGKRHDTFLEPGDFLIAHPGGWTIEHWENSQRMVSIAFWEDFVRVIHLTHDGAPPYPPAPEAFFHTPVPLIPAGKHALDALLAAAADITPVRHCLCALFGFIAEMLADKHLALPRPELEWKQVTELIRLNFTFDITRQDIAEMAGIHPARLSRLLKTRRGLSFCECINEMRLDYAKSLLRDDRLTVDEIADLCGFHYTNYFIRLFRRRFGVPPGHYRKQSLTVMTDSG